MTSETPAASNEKYKQRLGLLALLRRSRPINIITGPVIYSMVVPLLFLDVCICVYQAICFPVYKVTPVSRRDYIVFDRQELKYLDWVSKFHCTYCAYGVGVVAFAGAVIGKTEAYFCPIKHKTRAVPAKPTLPPYLEFVEPEDFDFGAKLSEIRDTMGSPRPPGPQGNGPQSE